MLCTAQCALYFARTLNALCTLYTSNIYRNKTKLMSNNYSRSNHYHWNAYFVHSDCVPSLFLSLILMLVSRHFFDFASEYSINDRISSLFCQCVMGFFLLFIHDFAAFYCNQLSLIKLCTELRACTSRETERTSALINNFGTENEGEE